MGNALIGALLVFLGGGIGSVARHGVNVLSTHVGWTKYPYGTFAVNVLGSLAIGILAEWLALRISLPGNLRLLLVTGILGGFTTFSAFTLEVGLLVQRGEAAAATIYAVASVVCGVAALFLGMQMVRSLVAP